MGLLDFLRGGTGNPIRTDQYPSLVNPIVWTGSTGTITTTTPGRIFFNGPGNFNSEGKYELGSAQWVNNDASNIVRISPDGANGVNGRGTILQFAGGKTTFLGAADSYLIENLGTTTLAANSIQWVAFAVPRRTDRPSWAR